MKPVIVYFHGYGSSPASDKVEVLRQSLSTPVYAFQADIDPEKAKAHIEHSIDMLLLDNMHSDDPILFIGTSLGGWMASEMAARYDVPAIVINPSCNPSTSLQKYGVPDDICAKYGPIKFSKKNTYFFAKRDEVIDNLDNIALLGKNGYVAYLDSDADHRYNGAPFMKVIDFIKQKYFKSP